MIGKLAIGKKAVVSDHQLATQVGLKILESGGNAFDAAIAVSAVLSVVQPHMGGPGGDGFLLAYRDGDVIALMSSGRSPSGFNPDEYLSKQPMRGPLTVTVPGLVALWSTIYDEYASRPLDELLRPAINLAYNGFYVGLSLAEASRASEAELSMYKWAKYFKGLKLGDVFKSGEMAKTLRLIASRGPEEFYYGKLAEDFIAELQNQGVDIGLDDFMEHEVYEVKPLKLEVDNKILYEIPPNTQGITTLQAISALYELGLDKLEFNSPERIIAWSKPTRDIYLFRDLYIGDPNYIEIDPQSYVEYKSIQSKLSLEGTMNKAINTSQQDTTFFIVSDGETIIGFIQSLFYAFGSGLVAGGFPVQNRGIGFARRKNVPNSPAPRKLPLHTLSVLGVESDDGFYIIGCVGGDFRPQLHLRVYENIFIYKMRLDRAVSAPRFIYTIPYEAQELVVEKPLQAPASVSGITVKHVNYGELRGHVHAARFKDGVATIACDPRSEGLPLGI